MESGKVEVAGPSRSEKKLEFVMKEEERERLFDNHDEDEDDVELHEDNKRVFEKFVPGPLLPLKEQIEKDKEDESLRRWKEKLLGCLETDLNAQMEPEVKFQSIGIISSDFGEISTLFPINEEKTKNLLFTLHEGSEFRLKLTFSVLHNIVSGLAYTNTVWKGTLQGLQSIIISLFRGDLKKLNSKRKLKSEVRRKYKNTSK